MDDKNTNKINTDDINSEYKNIDDFDSEYKNIDDINSVYKDIDSINTQHKNIDNDYNEINEIGKSNMIGDTIQSNNGYKQEINNKLNDKLVNQIIEEDVDTRIYIDDANNQNPNNQRPQQNQNRGYTTRPKKPPKKKTDKRVSTRKSEEEMEKSSARFYVITLIVAVIVCLVVSIVVFSVTLKNNRRNTPDEEVEKPFAIDTDAIEDGEELTDEDMKNMISSTGIIENISTSGSIQIYDFQEDRQFNLKYVKNTKLTDKSDKPLVIDELKIGQIVDYSYPKDKTSLESISLSNSGFENKNVTNIKNDTAAKIYTIGGNKYNYDEDRTVVTYGDNVYTPLDITEYDTVNITGYKDTVYYVEVINGHGKVTFVDGGNILNGIVEIDTTQTINLNSQTTATLSAGEHRIVVKGDNIDPYITNITVTVGAPVEVSLASTGNKKGVFVPTINPSNATVTIDGTYYDQSSPIELDYGAHSIKVTKEGYEDFQTTFTVKGAETRMNIKLDAIVKMGKVIISTDPIGADIYIDNAYIGKSPATQPVEYGTHTIMVKMDGYIEISLPVDVQSNDKQLSFTLQKKPSTTTVPTVDELNQ